MQKIFEIDFESDPPPPDWPFRQFSRAVRVSGVRWHVQRMGSGPELLLLHGSGGSVHSWSHCLGALAERFSVLAVDLPGHGFSDVEPEANRRGAIYSLEGMATALRGLLDAVSIQPVLAAGHSAGLAVLARMTIDGLLHAERLVGFNPALVAPPDAYVSLIAPLVGIVAESSLVARGAAWLAGATGVIPTMLGSTGTHLSREDEARYAFLCTRPSHCHAALSMMSRWDLPKLVRDASAMTTPMTLYAGTADRWVPLAALKDSVSRMPSAVMTMIEGAGHLIPEERPEVVVQALVSQHAMLATRPL